MREVSADISHPEHIDEELSQLVHLRRRFRDSIDQHVITRAACNKPVLVTHRSRARPRWRDDRVIAGERLDIATHRRNRFVQIPRVDHRLSATGLASRKIGIDAEAAQQPDRSSPRSGYSTSLMQVICRATFMPGQLPAP